jgi:hypothetical protein
MGSLFDSWDSSVIRHVEVAHDRPVAIVKESTLAECAYRRHTVLIATNEDSTISRKHASRMLPQLLW